MKKKTIFTTITLGLVTLLGFGFLGGIYYQSKEAKAIEITTKPTKKKAKVTDLSTIVNSSDIYYAVAKDYQSNGLGTFYTSTPIRLETSRGGYNYQLYAVANFDLITDNTITYATLNIKSALWNNAIQKLSQVYLYANGNSAFIYEAYNDSGSFKRQNCAFTFSNLKVYDNVQNTLYEISMLFDIYQLQSDYYEFNEINPYTYWNVDINSPYVTFATFDGSIQGLTHKDINLTPFYVGGLAFDTIRLYYIGVQNGDRFHINDSDITYSGVANRYMTFAHATYYNSATQYEIKFFQQEVSYGAYGYEGLTYLGSFNYTNLKIKTIQFFDKPTNIMINNLDNLSNLNQNIGYHSSTDVGLGNAFALISQAFTAWIPILSISVIPGISLGMLIFLPLIAGIVIFIIWIVKR